MTNHKVTALSVQKRNPRRVNIYLDGEFAFGVERIVAAWLQIGQEISDEKIEQLKAEDAREAAYQKALRLLSFRPRTEAEIRQKLQGYALSDDLSDHVLERLRQSGLVNDQRFSKEWVDNRSEMRPRSRRALAYELKRRGIDQQTIEQTTGSLDDDQLAYQAAYKHAHKLKDLEWKDFRQKMYRYLAQRGFNAEAAIEATRRVWAEAKDKTAE